MGSPPDDTSDRVDLGKHDVDPRGTDGGGAGERPDVPFDPYRFGAPDVPPPPEYAPPGYQPPPGYQYPGPPQPGSQQPGTPSVSAGPHGPYPPYPYGTTGQSQAPYGGPPGYGAPPYGPGPYGGSPYGGSPYGPGPQPGQGNGKAVAALVLGIVSIVLFWTTIFDAVFVILALVFGFLGLGDAKLRGGRGRGQALAGLICAAVGAVLAIVLLVFIIDAAGKCGGFSNQDESGFGQCVRDHL